MLTAERQSDRDVTNTVDVTDPDAVLAALQAIFVELYPDWDCDLLARLMSDFSRLYSGEYPGYFACDVGYHNMQHVLDVSLAMARLIDGHERSEKPENQLGADLAMMGMVAALFHDAGYIRKEDDERCGNGAAYTRVHVRRSAGFLLRYLPSVGLDHMLSRCRRLVYFTSYEINPDLIKVRDDTERRLGNMLGTADMLAQLADVNYIQKCRDHLYQEFVEAGYAGEAAKPSHTGMIYSSPEHLLISTPDFIRKTLDLRLGQQFEDTSRYAAVHFGGENLYLQAITQNQQKLTRLLTESSSGSAIVNLR